MTDTDRCTSETYPVWADGSQDRFTCALPEGHEGSHKSREEDGWWTW